MLGAGPPSAELGGGTYPLCLILAEGGGGSNLHGGPGGVAQVIRELGHRVDKLIVASRIVLGVHCFGIFFLINYNCN
jgi:hypothetical protein